MVPPPSQNTVGVGILSSFHRYYISYRLVTLLKVINAPLQLSDFFFILLFHVHQF